MTDLERTREALILAGLEISKATYGARLAGLPDNCREAIAAAAAAVSTAYNMILAADSDARSNPVSLCK